MLHPYILPFADDAVVFLPRILSLGVSKLGGKGANLAEMCSIGLSVPPGFTITTEICSAFHENGNEATDLDLLSSSIRNSASASSPYPTQPNLPSTLASLSTGSKLPSGVWEDVLQGLGEIEAEMGAKLGEESNPLLLSVRSGAAVGSS